MSSEFSTQAEATAESYYDSPDADTFYETIWGGEDIHIGLYEPGLSIPEASKRTVQYMADQLEGLGADSRVLDQGAGYGGSARALARRFGCHVTCVNISERENARNRKLNQEHGLDHLIKVDHGTFEEVPEPDASYDVVWSQDAFLHSGRRRQAIEECHRLLKRGGQLIFTDPMQTDDCPPDVLQPVYDRLALESLGSPGFYREVARALGMEEIRWIELTHQLRNHYATVREELERRRPELEGRTISTEYIEHMLTGLANWVKAADSGYLAWGILHFRKP